MIKPIVFNYRQYEELRDAYKELLEDNNKLMADNKMLREEKTNLEVRCRIVEADRIPVLYLCDGFACGHDCNANGCRHTRDIEYAKNFHKVGDKYYYEVQDAKQSADEIAADVKAIEADVKELLEIVKGD